MRNLKTPRFRKPRDSRKTRSTRFSQFPNPRAPVSKITGFRIRVFQFLESAVFKSAFSSFFRISVFHFPKSAFSSFLNQPGFPNRGFRNPRFHIPKSANWAFSSFRRVPSPVSESAADHFSGGVCWFTGLRLGCFPFY